jgi:hypothetical protein
MHEKSILWIALAFFAAFSLATLVGRCSTPESAPGTHRAQQWQYKVRWFANETQLQEAGKEGWRIQWCRVARLKGKPGWECILVRPELGAGRFGG